MMPTVNLLPWREWRRRRRSRLFLLQLGGVLAAALLTLGGAGWRLQTTIDAQEERNASLRRQVGALVGDIAAGREARQGHHDLLAQISALQSLEAQRTSVAHIFDALAHTLPDGVHYQAVALQGDLLSLTGAAESGAQVATLMRNLEASEIFTETRLLSVGEAGANAAQGVATRVFHLTAKHLGTARRPDSTQTGSQEGRGRP